MKRLQFLKVSLAVVALNVLTALTFALFAASVETYQYVTYGIGGLVLAIGALIIMLKSTAQRIKDVKPDADVLLYSMLFWILNILSSGIAYLVLMVWPSSKNQPLP